MVIETYLRRRRAAQAQLFTTEKVEMPRNWIFGIFAAIFLTAIILIGVNPGGLCGMKTQGGVIGELVCPMLF
jgi:hypothetical protein